MFRYWQAVTTGDRVLWRPLPSVGHALSRGTVGRATEPPWPEAGVSANAGNGRFSNPIPAVKRKRQLQTSVARGRADEEPISEFNALGDRS